MSPSDLDPNPWYIYECVPFLKDLKGYEDNSRNENKLLTNFIKEMNKSPVDLVSKFIGDRRPSSTSCSSTSSQAGDSQIDIRMTKGYVTRCKDDNKSMCCPNPWVREKCEEKCFLDYRYRYKQNLSTISLKVISLANAMETVACQDNGSLMAGPIVSTGLTKRTTQRSSWFASNAPGLSCQPASSADNRLKD